MLNKKIPTIEFPSINNYNIVGLEEEIIDLKDYGFIISPEYWKMGIAGAPKSCYIRKSVADMLLEAKKLLPEGYNFKLYDGWRPYAVQKRLWDMYYFNVKNNPENKNCTEEELMKKTSFFVSKPSTDINNPFLHNTGGAIDLTIVDANGIELNMGTKFDDFSEKAWTNHFEVYTDNEEIRNNRRLLYNVMISVGFTNLPSEWWHYDYGTKFWGYLKGKDALYTGVLDLDIKDVFPLL